MKILKICDHDLDMTQGDGDGSAHNIGPICMIIPKMNQIGDKIGNNEVLKALTKILTFVDANAAANAEGSIIALCERCSGELKMSYKVGGASLAVSPDIFTLT